MTCRYFKGNLSLIFIVLGVFLISRTASQAPFIELDTVHQAYSEFQINLILNENRNHPIILTTVSNNKSRHAADYILKVAHQFQPLSGFSILVECNKFNWNLNHSLRVCESYYEDKKKNTLNIDPGNDEYFGCDIFTPSKLRMKEKGHTVNRNHEVETLPDAKHFNSEYLSQVLKKNVPDLVHYIEDQYEMNQFLQENSESKLSKLPKLIYFDENLVAPIFIQRLSAMMDGRMEVGVCDDPTLGKKFGAVYDALLFFQYSFNSMGYSSRRIQFDDLNEQQTPDRTILNDRKISRYMKAKKSRDILLDFEFSNYTVYQFETYSEVEYLLTHGRPIVLETQSKGECERTYQLANNYGSFFNYICLKNTESSEKNLQTNSLFFIINSIESKILIDQKTNLYNLLPKNQSRQKVSTDQEVEHCIRTAEITKRDPIFYYFDQKVRANALAIAGYLNSLPQVTSLQYFCQIQVPDNSLIRKYNLGVSNVFTLTKEGRNGQYKKFEHMNISSFFDLKMFLREISIKNMLEIYQTRLLYSKVTEVRTAQQLTQACYNKKCIIALLSGRGFRNGVQMNILKDLKLQFQETFKFIWIDGVCNRDIAKQLGILKKKQNNLAKSEVFCYQEKDRLYNLWEGKKFWDRKQLRRWVKKIKKDQGLKKIKFSIDIEDKKCNTQLKKKKDDFEEL